jgi:hypothetical protein
MGLYFNWPDARHNSKQELAKELGATPCTYEAFNRTDVAVLVWVNNILFDALAYAYCEREFEAMTLIEDTRQKRFFLLDKSVAEQNAK